MWLVLPTYPLSNHLISVSLASEIRAHHPEKDDTEMLMSVAALPGPASSSDRLRQPPSLRRNHISWNCRCQGIRI